MKTEIYAAFCGMGKSHLCKSNPNKYKEIECWEYRSGDFPNNYVEEIVKTLGKTEYLFISTDPIILKELNKINIKVNLVYPENELRNEYLERYIERDNPYDFIGTMMKHWHLWINELKDQTYCNQIVLGSGEYLSDVIDGYGSMEIPKPIGSFIIQNAKGVSLSDGQYYHYSEVCKLLKLYKNQS